MNLAALSETLDLENLTPNVSLEGREIHSAYASDLLSDVLAHAPHGGVLITVQIHLNVIAVALHAELAAVIFALGRKPDGTTCAKAEEEGIVLLMSREPAFDLAGKLYAMGIRGADA